MMNVPTDASPALALTLSLIPGLGHLYLGKKQRATALLVTDLGIFSGIYITWGSLASLVLCVPYFFIMIPAALESYHLAKGNIREMSTGYIVLLLLTKGFWGLPLLWQSSLFSKKIKILWSVLVPIFAVLYFGTLFYFGRALLSLIQPLLDKKIL